MSSVQGPGGWGAYRTAHERVPRPPRAATPLAKQLIFSYQGSQAVLRIIGLAFMAMGGLMSVIFCWGLPVDVALALGGRRAQGTVETTRLNTKVSINGEHPTEIAFRYEVGGKAYRAESSTLDGSIVSAARGGGPVPVEILPVHPQWARVQGTSVSPFGLLGLLVLVFPVVGAGLLFHAVRSNLREIRAYRHGIPVTGLVVKRGQDTTVEVNGRHPYEVVWEFQVAQARHRGRLSHMDGALLERALPGNEVTVLYDPANPAVNTVWFD
ncbi:DUF3592 domain-containing protein [Chondromyces apiculatus]|uniref:DUF3592 domain-containing protein n=1 Tax=Chondromyces apiculatus DSM 436 TaxID=1192034 RepID=A0A017SXE0_9BACT|nr:DUF3592 domain-containing protein [Chondromyces apiculatus]EYF01639.1 Hypothetical protein CAP_7958 [Chondromyces apiculatus DSM 436]